MTIKLEWLLPNELEPNPKNWRRHPDQQKETFKSLFAEVGWAGALLYNEATGKLIDGHLRRAEMFAANEPVPVLVGNWTEQQEALILTTLDPLAAMAQADVGLLDNLLKEIKTTDETLTAMLSELAEDNGLYFEGLNDGGNDDPPIVEDTPPQIDKADELQQVWQVQEGDLWLLGGKHRLICGDCTDRATVERLMGGEKADLVAADPPYGMGKEKDGIANDNLYRDKLDAFQMQWWSALRASLKDNASAYIWGNAEDLWRLWYVGGLRDSERLTLRNEIVWSKQGGQGIGSDAFRSFPPTSERCLFFMLGEQGFNNNADNYWEGWENIRLYLKSERDKMGWSNKTVADMFNFHPRMASHWFDESQWSFIREEQYQKLQAAAKGDAFKREYDDLKREFYATRAYFDNTHDNMTDVWNFARVTGEDRHNHATPKPVEMMARIIKSSCPVDGLTVDPFLGSGTTLLAAHQTNRIAYGSEISPKYVAVCLQRYQDATGETPKRIDQ